MTHIAKLKWITTEAEREIVEIGRVSSDPEVAKRPDDALIAYLIRNRHWSPFEMASMCLEIDTTRDIGRQLLRHRSFHFQEFSQRYADVSILGDAVLRDARMKHPTNRQMSLPCDDGETSAEWKSEQSVIFNLTRDVYEYWLDKGIAKEVARAILPEGLTRSRMYMSGTIRDWIHFINVRMDPTAQKEAQLVAESAQTIFTEQMPTIARAVWGDK